jgi:L-alanine-DL-glutamate epimerase-like enolase superfamily enzyme
MEFRNGAMRAPSGPGLGVELNDEMVARYRVD